MADFGDGAGDLRGAISSTLDVAGNFLGGGALLLDRRRYRGGDLGNLADGRTDHLDRADRLPRFVTFSAATPSTAFDSVARRQRRDARGRSRHHEIAGVKG